MKTLVEIRIHRERRLVNEVAATFSLPLMRHAFENSLRAGLPECLLNEYSPVIGLDFRVCEREVRTASSVDCSRPAARPHPGKDFRRRRDGPHRCRV